MTYARGLKRSPVFVSQAGTVQIHGGQATFQELWATNATVSADLAVGANLAVTGDLDVNGDFTFGDSTADELSVSGNLIVTGSATVTSNLIVSGSGTFTSNLGLSADLIVAGSATVTGNLLVSGYTTTEAIYVAGLVTTSSDITAGNDLIASNDLSVTGSATITSNLIVSGSATITSNLGVSGNFTFGDTATDLMTINGLASFGGPIQLQTSSTTIVSSVAGAYITTSGDEILILCNSNAQTGAVTYSLLTADCVNGRVLIFKDIGGMSGTATSGIHIRPGLATQLIDGLTAVTMKPDNANTGGPVGYGSLSVFSDGASWWTI